MRKEVLAVGPDTSILDLAEMMMGQKAQDLSCGGGGAPARGHQPPQCDAGHPRPAWHLFRASGQSLNGVVWLFSKSRLRPALFIHVTVMTPPAMCWRGALRLAPPSLAL